MSEYFKIRPHHMLCLQFFEGKGYSKEFVNNMISVKNKLESTNPLVQIVEETDDICKDCPNNIDGKCKEELSVMGHDRRVYDEVKHIIKTKASWEEITISMYKNIINNNKLEKVCGQCQWSEICFRKGNKRQDTGR